MRPFEIKPRLYVGYELKYGEKAKASSGKSYPKKLKYLKLVKRERGADGNFKRHDEAHKMLLGDKPTSVPIILASDDVYDVFSIYRGAFSNKGELMCGRFHGEKHAHRRFSMENLTSNSSSSGQYFSGGDMPKNGVDICPPYQYQCTESCQIWGAGRCSFHGILYFNINVGEDVYSGASELCALRISGIYAQTSLLASLEWIKSITGGILANLPLTINLHYEKLSKAVSVGGKTIYPDIPKITVSPGALGMSHFMNVELPREIKRRADNGYSQKYIDVFKPILRSNYANMEVEDEVIEDEKDQEVFSEENEGSEDLSVFDDTEYSMSKKRLLYERFGGDHKKIKEFIKESDGKSKEEDYIF
jgi:hypothetical protein